MSEYELMCKDSPIQKEWNPKGSDLVLEEVMDFDIIRYNEDNTATVELKGKKNVVKNCPMTQYYEKWEFHKYFTWLPRQEDWQEIYSRYMNVCDTCTFVLNDWNNEYLDTNPKFPLDLSTSEFWTMLWCLFVHEVAYRLTWSWEEKKWKKE